MGRIRVIISSLLLRAGFTGLFQDPTPSHSHSQIPLGILTRGHCGGWVERGRLGPVCGELVLVGTAQLGSEEP